MKKETAFTLIELLVVIAIIALLLSVLVPALRRVKQQAAGAVCLSNIRQLAVAWQSYSADHDGEIVHGHVPRTSVPDPTHRFWVHYPQTEAGVYRGEPADVRREYELIGIRRGALFDYLNTFDVYHCPGDKSSVMFASTEYATTKSWWNSYSITGMMNGEELYRTGVVDKVAKKTSDLVNPGGKVVFLENVDERGWIMGSWLMNYANNPTWVDPIAIWHYERGTLGFADAHAEMHNWRDGTTIENAEAGRVIHTVPRPNESGEDIRYMQRAYVPRR
ncbi:MAG TPA: type II secretion system protein [Anaerohalosphaeraceae bacterium]|nr:type II secretion system protein [Phycisphaerae bacterium]HOM61799.1 type II secretion system protein [Anaerohalosphaeraceae bacterium]HOT73506.1 type II secretion system protein [Anaerohalosphaeraceae bacterium]HPB93375.1 type II secretion system protein [Anaerohalosphaeraceae bacterium]HQG06600.1 type II secretion system protein [Anaerohalosphaeraceae bacterium]